MIQQKQQDSADLALVCGKWPESARIPQEVLLHISVYEVKTIEDQPSIDVCSIQDPPPTLGGLLFIVFLNIACPHKCLFLVKHHKAAFRKTSCATTVLLQKPDIFTSPQGQGNSLSYRLSMGNSPRKMIVVDPKQIYGDIF